eukprot:GHRR01011858.1.p1 GENE.GHRR01011858.1~~GHRR01011858.1.p1  ORF type:complete len:171 (+),score=34.61 GHRR01011858.1:187-699(+)
MQSLSCCRQLNAGQAQCCKSVQQPMPTLRRPSSPAHACKAGIRQAGPGTPEPNYTSIDSQPLNKLVMALFRAKMVAAIGQDSQLQGYDAIIDLTRRLNSKFAEARQVQLTTRGILNSLFPSWLPGVFKVAGAYNGAARFRMSRKLQLSKGQQPITILQALSTLCLAGRCD